MGGAGAEAFDVTHGVYECDHGYGATAAPELLRVIASIDASGFTKGSVDERSIGGWVARERFEAVFAERAFFRPPHG